MSDAEKIKADILATRAELAETADAIAAKLDVKAQASERLHAAAEDKKRTALVVGGVVLALVVFRRVRKARRQHRQPAF